MKKTLLTLVLLMSTLLVGAANHDGLRARLSKKVPVSLTKKVQTPGLSRQLCKSPRKAEGQTIDLDFTTSDFIFDYYDMGDASFWYYSDYDDSQQYCICLAYTTASQYGYVNYEDINQDYSYIEYDATDTTYYTLRFEEGTALKITEQDGNVSITGTAVCSDGNTYNIFVNEPLPQPQTYDIEGEVLTMAEYYGEDQEWGVRFKNDDWKITLSLKSEDGTFPGTYTMDDAVWDNYATDLNEDEDYAFTEMNITLALPEGNEDPADGCEVTGTAKDNFGNTFNFHMLKHAPLKPKEVKNIDVDVNIAEWPSDMTEGSYYVLSEKADPTNQWTLSLNKLVGEATDKDGIDKDGTYRANTESDEILTVEHGTITQTFNSDQMAVTTDVELVMSDSIQYNFSFTSPVSTNGEKMLTFSDLHLDTSYSEWGSTSLEASNDSLTFDVELTDYASLPGEYSDDVCRVYLEVFDPNYTDPEEAYHEVSCLALISAKGEVAEDGSPIFHTKFLGSDKIVYTVEANYVQPAIADTLHLEYTADVEMGDNTEWGEGFYFTHEDGTSRVWIKVEADQVEGHYTMADVNPNSTVALLNAIGMPKYNYLTDADFTVTREGRTYTLTGTCTAGAHYIYLTMSMDIQGIDFDNYEEDAEATYTTDDIAEITPDENAQSVYVKYLSKERNDELCLTVFPETYDGDNIPAAYYEINSYGWGPSVQAGSNDGFEMTPSYYAKLSSTGKVQAPLWFLTSGSMNVSEDGTVEIDAKNSYGRTIHITCALPTGILAAKADTQKGGVVKFLRDRELIIRKAGVEYSVTGMRK